MRKVRIGFFILLLSAVLAPIISYFLDSLQGSHITNRLKLGEGAPEGTISIPRVLPADFGGLQSDEILQTRVGLVNEHSELLDHPYAPSRMIFENMRSGAPWFGLAGFFIHGRSDTSISGKSAESRNLLNPYLLVAPEFWGLSIWAEQNLKWDLERVGGADIETSSFPLYPAFSKVSWQASERKASVEYDISGYLEQVNQWTVAPLTRDNVDFGISAYNAKDLGLQWIYLDLSRSNNIQNGKNPKEAVWIRDSVRYNPNLCGKRLGCNHRSRSMPEFDTIKVAPLPAAAVFKLWEKQPADHSQQADFEFTVVLK